MPPAPLQLNVDFARREPAPASIQAQQNQQHALHPLLQPSSAPKTALKAKPTAAMANAQDPPSQIFRLQEQSAANGVYKDAKDARLALTALSHLYLRRFPSQK